MSNFLHCLSIESVPIFNQPLQMALVLDTILGGTELVSLVQLTCRPGVKAILGLGRGFMRKSRTVEMLKETYTCKQERKDRERYGVKHVVVFRTNVTCVGEELLLQRMHKHGDLSVDLRRSRIEVLHVDN